jgi:hypothetical protein
MIDLEPSWRVYARLQEQCRRRTRLDAQAWGIESGMDELLNGQFSHDPNTLTAEAEKAAARGKARERHRFGLRLRYLDPREVSDPTGQLDDRARLREIMDRASEAEGKMLLGMGVGHDSAVLAGQFSIRPTAMRKRLDRLRTRLAA